MKLKRNVKFKEKLTCVLKNDLRHLLIFMQSVDGLLFPKAYKNLDEKVQKSDVSWHWRMMQVLKKKLTLDSKIDTRNLVNLNVSSGRSKNLHFDVLLLSITYKVSAEKTQKNYFWWHLKEIQTFKENWPCLKNDMRNLLNFSPSSRNRKISTIMGHFCKNYVVFELEKIQRSCVVKNDTMT